MRRREVCSTIGFVGVYTLSGCAELQGVVFGKHPENFKIKNDRVNAVEVKVVIEGDTREILNESYKVPHGVEESYPWPGAKSDTYTIKVVVGGDETRFTFNPSDWNKRKVPVIRVFEGGVGVFVEN